LRQRQQQQSYLLPFTHHITFRFAIVSAAIAAIFSKLSTQDCSLSRRDSAGRHPQTAAASRVPATKNMWCGGGGRPHPNTVQQAYQSNIDSITAF
jgi:hypothetical protein